MRFKTGTPVRVDSQSIDYGRMTRQDGDADPQPFSFLNEDRSDWTIPDPMACWMTWTAPQTKEVVTANLSRSPLFSGVIQGTGPRYCPSLEDKFVRFPDKERHQVFVEPTGRDTEEMYLQGVSSSLPEDVQIRMVQSIDGLDRARIMRKRLRHRIRLPGSDLPEGFSGNPSGLRAFLRRPDQWLLRV